MPAPVEVAPLRCTMLPKPTIVDRAQMLIAHGADPNLVDHHIGANPWAWANHFHHEDVAAYLYPLTEHESGDTSS